MPKVSIIIPVYNTKPYLEACLDTIINQSLQDIEIICINDGSTDGSLNILEAYAERDARITVLSQENKGQSSARNLGLSIATGEYVYFMDSDDLLSLDSLSYLYGLAQQQQLDIVYFNADVFFESEQVKKDNLNYVDYYVRNASYPNVQSGLELLIAMEAQKDYKPSPCLQFIRMRHLQKNNIRFYEGIIHEDNLFSFLTIVSAERAMQIENVFFHRRVREDSTMTKAKSAKNVIGYFTCFVEMQQYCLCHQLENSALTGLMEEVLQNARKDYEALSTVERKKVTWPQSSENNLLFDQLVKRTRLKNKLKSILLYIPRKLQRIWKYYCEHGLSETLQKVKQKLLK